MTTCLKSFQKTPILNWQFRYPILNKYICTQISFKKIVLKKDYDSSLTYNHLLPHPDCCQLVLIMAAADCFISHWLLHPGLVFGNQLIISVQPVSVSTDSADCCLKFCQNLYSCWSWKWKHNRTWFFKGCWFCSSHYFLALYLFFASILALTYCFAFLKSLISIIHWILYPLCSICKIALMMWNQNNLLTDSGCIYICFFTPIIQNITNKKQEPLNVL